nr:MULTISPECIES: ATP-binding protein [unclassified Burkholderia]
MFVQQAHRQGFSVLYVRVARLFEELKIAHRDGSFTRRLAQLGKIEILRKRLPAAVVDSCRHRHQSDVHHFRSDRHHFVRANTEARQRKGRPNHNPSEGTLRSQWCQSPASTARLAHETGLNANLVFAWASINCAFVFT